MYSHSHLECLTDGCSFDALANASPEGCIQQDDIHRNVEDVCRKLLEVHNNGVRGKRHPHLLPGSAHTCEPVDRIFQVVVANILYSLPEPYGGLSRPDSVR